MQILDTPLPKELTFTHIFRGLLISKGLQPEAASQQVGKQRTYGLVGKSKT